MNIEALKESLRIHEGLVLRPYTCPAGKLTIGIGKNLDEGITIQQAYALLDLDIQTCAKELDRHFPGWTDHNDARQNVLLEMCFNMGAPRLQGFHKMWGALQKNDYKAASDEMLSSKWAKQVGVRAVTLANQMRDGWE